jgi:hypothetical protein
MKFLPQITAVSLISLGCLNSCMAQSLGDAARQQQTQKKSAPVKTKHVITNDDIASGVKPADSSAKPSVKKGNSVTSDSDAATDADRPSAQEIQANIKEQRQRILDIEVQMKVIQKEMGPWKTTDCTHVLHANSSMNTCDVPQKLAADYEAAKAQLEQEKKNLVSMQEEARKMGYANSVYDPN